MFRVGGSTKTFVATVVLRLVAGGKVGLDAPAADHLPRFGPDRRITVRMPLQHTSGLFDFSGGYYDDGTPVVRWSSAGPGCRRSSPVSRNGAAPPPEGVRARSRA
ncbi:class A beta-lactamase-related serine hydrolase [Streptomyces ipomoeae]|nr:class A beta-lactamase-related serine hydrolase [Streptomyces ipomoeae]